MKTKIIISIILTITLFSIGIFVFLKKKEQILKKQVGLSTSEKEEDSSSIAQRKLMPDPASLKTIINEPDETGVVIEICRIGFWNINPPSTPLNQLKKEAQSSLEIVKDVVLSGSDFKTVCNKKLEELKQQNSDFYGGFSQRESYEGQLFNKQNKEMEDGSRKMIVETFQIFPVHDGGYIKDNIVENDGDYISEYYLIKRIK